MFANARCQILGDFLEFTATLKTVPDTQTLSLFSYKLDHIVGGIKFELMSITNWLG